MSLPPNDLAYVAGFFDGEGSIVITRGSRNERFVLNVCVVNTDRDVLEMIRAGLGGNIFSRSRSGSLGKRKLFSLQWSGASAAKCLLELYPYLRIKKGKAEVALRFQATMKRRGSKGTPSAILAERTHLREQMHMADPPIVG